MVRLRKTQGARIDARRICDWAEIADRRWETLLLGNGMSINLDRRFDYKSLFVEAEKSGTLSRLDRKIFDAVGSRNFEVVLSRLRDAMAIAAALGDREAQAAYRARFRSIQAALGETVSKVHPDPRSVPAATWDTMQEAFRTHKAIFSTSYDLLAYWVISHPGGYEHFCDHFWADGHRFDVSGAGDRRRRIPIYYLHGALHLVVCGTGATKKLTRDDLDTGDEQILDLFAKPLAGDPDARPLLVTEGSSRDKLQAIEANEYLAFVYEKFKADEGSLVVFGLGFGDQDQHLIDAIKDKPDRQVAISIRTDRDPDSRRLEILAKLGREEGVCFFDAASHPLGSSKLRLP